MSMSSRLNGYRRASAAYASSAMPTFCFKSLSTDSTSRGIHLKVRRRDVDDAEEVGREETFGLAEGAATAAVSTSRSLGILSGSCCEGSFTSSVSVWVLFGAASSESTISTFVSDAAEDLSAMSSRLNGYRRASAAYASNAMPTFCFRSLSTVSTSRGIHLKVRRDVDDAEDVGREETFALAEGAATAAVSTSRSLGLPSGSCCERSFSSSVSVWVLFGAASSESTISTFVSDAAEDLSAMSSRHNGYRRASAAYASNAMPTFCFRSPSTDSTSRGIHLKVRRRDVDDAEDVGREDDAVGSGS
eukprot:PhM_4_TR8467/c5_g1_i4/m.47118